MGQPSLSYKLFTVANTVFLVLLTLLCALPVVHVFAVSLSSSWAADVRAVTFWPVDFTLISYQETFRNENFLRSLLTTIIVAVSGTALTLTLISMAAYPLSRSESSFPGRQVYSWFFVFIMLFNGGLIPTYLVVTGVGLKNSLLALILPAAINVWNMVLLLNFFRSLPNELEEASRIDGASHFQTLLRIYLPVSKPALATLSLFLVVGHWNEWFSGLIYLSDVRNYPLATFLRTILITEDFSQLNIDPALLAKLSDRTLKASQIFIAMVPIMLVYPFLQKYFVKGLVVGSVKG